MEPVKSRRVIFYDQDKKVTILIITSSHKIKNPLEALSRPDRAFNCGNVLSFVANKASHPSEDGKRSEAAVTQEAEPITAERRRELEHYLKLKRYTTATVCLTRVSHNYNQPPDFQCISFSFFFSEGWLQDRSGKWVKDENVEFDSDEEEPPSLDPLPTSH